MNIYTLIAFIVGVIASSGFYFISNKTEVVTPSAKEVPSETSYGETTPTPKDTPSAPAPITSASTIDLSNQSLTKVPADIFTKTKTEVLDVSGNNLMGSLPAEVRHLSNLRVLDLSDNDFTGVPAEIGQLSKLEILNLSGNPITGLPYELGNLKNLKELNLKNTNFSKQDLEIIQKGLPASVRIVQ